MVSLNICADSTEPPLLDTAISNYISFNYLLFEIAKVWWFKMVLRVQCISETNAIKTNPMYTLYRSQPDAAVFVAVVVIFVVISQSFAHERIYPIMLIDLPYYTSTTTSR